MIGFQSIRITIKTVFSATRLLQLHIYGIVISGSHVWRVPASDSAKSRAEGFDAWRR